MAHRWPGGRPIGGLVAMGAEIIPHINFITPTTHPGWSRMPPLRPWGPSGVAGVAWAELAWDIGVGAPWVLNWRASLRPVA